jgi:hypothetical protein
MIRRPDVVERLDRTVESMTGLLAGLPARVDRGDHAPRVRLVDADETPAGQHPSRQTAKEPHGR